MFGIHNKTTYDVVILDRNDQEIKRYKTNGSAILLEEEVKKVAVLGQVPLTRTEIKQTQELPPYKKNVYYIVSQQVKQTLPRRKDLLIPAEIVVSNRAQQIIGCRSLGA